VIMERLLVKFGPLVVAAPAVLMLAYAAKFGVRIPIWDGWSWILLLKEYQSGERSLLGVLSFVHIEHPYGLPSALFIAVGYPFRYRFDPVCVVCAGFICVGALVFLRGAHRDSLRGLFNFLLIAAVLLSLRQCDNILYAFQLGFPITVALGLIAIYSAVKIGEMETTRTAAAWIALLVFLLSAAMLSSAAAPACFVGAALPLFLSRGTQALRALMAVALAAAFWVGRYIFSIFRHTRARPEEAGGAADALVGFLSVIGSGLTDSRAGSVIAGLVILATFVILLVVLRRQGRQPVFLISVGLFSLALAATVTAGRGGMGGIVPGRYTSFTLPLVAATLALLFLWLREQPLLRRRMAMAACAILLGISIAKGTAVAWDSGKVAHTQAAILAAIMKREGPKSAQEIGLLNPGPTTLIDSLVQFLKEEKYNLFASPSLR